MSAEHDPLPMPQEGGAWIRLPDGTLVRETPAEDPVPAEPPADPTPRAPRRKEA